MWGVDTKYVRDCLNWVGNTSRPFGSRVVKTCTVRQNNSFHSGYFVYRASESFNIVCPCSRRIWQSIVHIPPTLNIHLTPVTHATHTHIYITTTPSQMRRRTRNARVRSVRGLRVLNCAVAQQPASLLPQRKIYQPIESLTPNIEFPPLLPACI